VVCNAAGNDQALIDYPASLSGYVTVGASNQFDERKTRASQDGEDWWGSSFGPTMWLLAPGVQIQTTDITGGHGDSSGDYTGSFNGTSAATPHVAAVAALMLSANPALSASDVRQMLKASAHKLAGQSGFTIQLGWGRLDAARAVRMAAGKEDAPTKPKPKPKPKPKKKPKKKKKAKKAGGRK
jgi:subtilisin family serine protease